MGDPLRLSDDDLLAECEVDHYRSSGPGGQKKNKTSSAVRLRHGPSGAVVTATEDRSQHVNLKRAMRRLRQAISLQVATGDPESGVMPGDILRSRLRKDHAGRPLGELLMGPRDPDYHLCVRDALLVIMSNGLSARDSAVKLEMTTGQFVKLIASDDKLLARVNQLRRAAGLKTLEA